MSDNRPPAIDISFAELPTDPKERHEMLVDVFGRNIMWLRTWTMNATRKLAESEESREKLGTIRRKRFDELAALTPEQRETVFKISEITVDRYIQLLLTLLGAMGIDQRMGSDHAVRFRLDLEICELENLDVVANETINRNGKRVFAEYWGRWLNQFASA